MIPQTLDLDRYANWLFSLATDIEAIQRERINRLVYTTYLLSCRTIINGTQSDLSKRLIDSFTEESRRLQSVEIKNYVGHIADYFLPNRQERELIQWQRSSFFAQSVLNFQQSRKRWFLSISELIQKELGGLSYKYELFYKEGEPIQMAIISEPRQGVLLGLIQDFSTYDYACYLRELPANLTNITQDNPGPEKVQSVSPSTFIELIPDEEHREFIIQAMRDLRITDNVGRCALHKKEGGVLLGFFCVMVDSGFIPQTSQEIGISILSNHIGTTFKKMNRDTDAYERGFDRTADYLKRKKIS